MSFETVIGLEIHAQLSTNSKLFSDSSTKFGASPNTSTNFIDAGFPGTLPVVNHQAILLAIKFGLAINATIHDLSYFERKNYFYPDLPKGYQISQYRKPIIGSGYIEVHDKKIHIDHAHLEEDAGKSTHNSLSNYTSIDLNRAGIPLLEIVTTPCMYSATEAIDFLKHLHKLLRFLKVCDGNMQEGSFRCDVNLSIRKKGESNLGVRTELKNLNSFRFIEKAIRVEELRHQDIILSGEKVIQQTRLYYPDTNTTHPMRDKENENDYRYFIDPDLLPIKISAKELDEIKRNMPPLPNDIKIELLNIDQLNEEEAEFLLSSPEHVNFYQEVKQHTHASNKSIINWLKGVYTAKLNEYNLSFKKPPVSAKNLGYLLNKLSDNIIQPEIAKKIFTKLMSSDLSIDEIIKSMDVKPMLDEAILLEITKRIINSHPEQVKEYQSGKDKLLGFFVGKIMAETKGQASAKDINILLKNNL